MPFIPSRSTIAWMTSGGLLAPPIQPVFRELTSAVSSASWLSRSMKWVGMPLSTVTRSRSIRRKASAGSQRSIRIIAPPVISGGSTPVHAPAMWKNGMWFITRLEASMSIASEIEHSLRSTRLECTAPFG